MNTKKLAETLVLTYKLIRPIIPLSGGMGAWIIAQLCQAGTVRSWAAAIAIALGTIGASFYHYGGANWMYARKSDRLKFSEPESLRLIGLIIFGISISIAALWLPKQCVIICVFNTVAIAAYSAKLSSHWTTKNITMSIISATPILIGWQAGTITHDIVFWGIPIASVAHLAREIIRDVQDIKANEGKRITLPIRFSETSALYISGILLLIATVVVILFMRFISGTLQNVMASLSALLFLYTATKLFIFKKPSHCPTLINASISCIILAVWYTI